MRLLFVLLTLSSLPTFAGETGMWTGYVTGWVPSTPRRSVTPWAVPKPRFPDQPVPPHLVWQQYAAQQALLMHLAYSHEQRLELHRSEAVRQQAEAEERLTFTQEQRLAAQQLAAREQQLAAEQQLLSQRQILLQQERLLREQEEMAARLEAQQQQAAASLAAEQAAAQLREEKERESKALAPKARVKGPDVHRWVDEDGVVHYSTKRQGEKR